MTRWEHVPEICTLAEQLGVGGAAPVDGILDHCRRRIDGWVSEAGGVTNIDALESLVTQRLQMVFEEIRSDVRDKDGLPHNLIHCEYPTPFRCDMKNMGFQLKSETDRTPKGKKYKRGHYDIVVLNPTFLARHSYSAIKCQDYDEYLLSVASVLLPNEPFVLYGIELDFSRDTIKPSRGTDWEKAGRTFVTEVAQDSAKLAASVAVPGFMKKAAMLAFTKGTSGKVMDLIRTGLQAVPSARLVVA